MRLAAPVGCAQLSWKCREHARRYRRHVEAMPRKLVCQECGGAGEWHDIIDAELGGPWVDCGFCRGTGFLVPWDRGQWLRWKREDRAEARAKALAKVGGR